MAKAIRDTKIIIWLLVPISVVFIILIVKQAGNGLSYVGDAPARQRAADRERCESNLKTLGVSLLNYASADPSHHFPASLASIPDLPADWTKSPVTGKPYAYIGGGLTNDASAVPAPVIVYETEAYEGGINFLYSDGRVEWFTEQTANNMIAKLKSGKNPPP